MIPIILNIKIMSIIIYNSYSQQLRTMNKIFLLFLIFVSVNSYTPSIARDMTFLSDIAYSSLAQINAWSCSLCAQFPVKSQKGFFTSNADIQGYAAYYTKQNAILVSFRGSADLKNWLANLDTSAVTYPGCSGCTVHRGFYNAYAGVSTLVRAQVNRLMSLFKGAKLVITGHSLGGALAALCSLDMKQLHGKVDYVYTFGQPRVGNQNFANFIQAQIPNTFRVIDYADTVPHVPPMAFGFRHGGHELWYSPRGMQTYKQCVSEDTSCANSISATSLSTDDHQLTNYEKLKAVTMMSKTNLNKEQGKKYTLSQIMYAQARKVEQIQQLMRDQLKN